DTLNIKTTDCVLARSCIEITEPEVLTRVEQSLGTSEYVPPEQALDSSTADIRADIFSLGCTLFELLTGELPFPGKSPVERLAARLRNEAPSICSLRADVPMELGRIAKRMMARDPGDRFQTPAEVAAALAPFCRLDEGQPGGASAAADRVSHLSAAQGSSDSDPAVNQFLESLSGDLCSRSLPSLSLARKPSAVLRWLTVWIAVV